MNNKRKSLFVGLCCVAVLGTALVFAAEAKVGATEIGAENQCAGHAGYHYEAKAATFDASGWDEYWICCNCHNVFLEEPAEGSWQDGSEATMVGGAPTVGHAAYQAKKAMSAKIVTATVNRVGSNPYTNYVDVDSSYYAAVPTFYKNEDVKIADLYSVMNLDLDDFVNDYQTDNKVKVSTDEGSTWSYLVDLPNENVKLTSLTFCVSTYKGIGAAGNGNCNLNGGAATYINPNGSIVIKATDSTRRWGAIQNAAGTAALSSKDLDLVADVKLTHVGTGKTTTSVQIANQAAGQRCVYCWDGSVDGSGNATVYYGLSNNGDSYPSSTSFKIHAENNTISFRAHVYSYQNAKGELSGKITWDAFAYGADIATAAKLHTQVVKNLAGFTADSPTYVNIAPEVRLGTLDFKVVSLTAN